MPSLSRSAQTAPAMPPTAAPITAPSIGVRPPTTAPTPAPAAAPTAAPVPALASVSSSSIEAQPPSDRAAALQSMMTVFFIDVLRKSLLEREGGGYSGPFAMMRPGRLVALVTRLTL